MFNRNVIKLDQKRLGLRNNEAGFTPFRSCVDQIHTRALLVSRKPFMGLTEDTSPSSMMDLSKSYWENYQTYVQSLQLLVNLYVDTVN